MKDNFEAALFGKVFHKSPASFKNLEIGKSRVLNIDLCNSVMIDLL